MSTTTRRALAALAITCAAAVGLAGAPSAAAATVVKPSDLSVHLENIPDGAGVYPNVLHNAVQLAISHQSTAGSFEVAGKTIDLGDNSLGVSSLVALYYSQTGDASVTTAFQRSVDWYLANRVYTYDNPRDTNLLVKNSGRPWAAYEPYSIAAGAGGDWPTTVWALLHVDNVLQYGDGLLRADQRAALVNLGLGYWTWLTSVSRFNPQDADNQAIGSVDGALQLAGQLTRFGMAAQARQLSAQAMNVFMNQVRPLRETDRGYTFYPEHSGGFDQNYGAISVSFLWQGWRLTGNPVFFDDGLEMAKYLDMRLGARGFDYGGPRHNEDHPGFEALYGLQHYSQYLKDDVGRYLGTATIQYYHVGTEPDHVVVPDGHVAFMTVWQMTQPASWYRTAQTVNSTYKMRVGNGSLVLDAQQQPYLITAGDAEVIDAATSGQQGIGLAYTDGTGTHLMRPAPNSHPVSRGYPVSNGQARTVLDTLTGPNGLPIPVSTTYLIGNGTVRISTRYPAALLTGVSVSYVAGLPYLTDLPGAVAPTSPQQKILSVSGLGGGTMSFGADGARLTDPSGITAGPLAISSPAGVTVTNPDTAASNNFSDSATLGMTLEQYSVALAGNPNDGFAKTAQTNLVSVPAVINGGMGGTDVSYGPAGN
ncbi:MAG TPA: hypothetical protein VGM75_09370 [Pseudonocardiaceae bacterium]